MWCRPSSAIGVSSRGKVIAHAAISSGSVRLGPAMATKASSVQLLSQRELRAWRGLLRIHSRLVKALDTELEGTHGLAVTSYEVLMYLADSPEGRMRMHDLASSVLLSRSGLTRLIDRLEREGCIRRGSSEPEGRAPSAVVPAPGGEKLEAARRTHLDGVRRHFLE